jgi:hypothetical protein
MLHFPGQRTFQGQILACLFHCPTHTRKHLTKQRTLLQSDEFFKNHDIDRRWADYGGILSETPNLLLTTHHTHVSHKGFTYTS